MIKITEVVLVWFGGDLIFRTYIYVFCELGPVKKKRKYTYDVAKGLRSDGTSIYICSPETVVCLFRPMKIMDSAFVYITTRQL